MGCMMELRKRLFYLYSGFLMCVSTMQSAIKAKLVDLGAYVGKYADWSSKSSMIKTLNEIKQYGIELSYDSASGSSMVY